MNQYIYLIVASAFLMLSACGGSSDAQNGSVSTSSDSQASSINSVSSHEIIRSESSISSTSSAHSSISSINVSSSRNSSVVSSVSSVVGTDDIIYNGESKPFSAASVWDENGSSLAESITSPNSGSNHLRALFAVSNWWSGVAYVPANWAYVDWSNGTELRFYAKSNTPVTLSVYLYDGNEKQSVSAATVPISTTYTEHTVKFSNINSGVDLKKIVAVVFGVSSVQSGSYTIDFDDIVVERGGATASSYSSSSATHSYAGISDWKKRETQRLHTKGNKIYYEDGSVFRARGANIHDTRSCNSCTWGSPNVAEVKRRIDELVDGWGANFMRLNLESYGTASGRVHWQSFTEDPQYLADIVDIINYIGTKPGVYVLVSLWAEPSTTAMGWPTAATNSAWKVLATALGDKPQVLLGVINEPQSNSNGANDAEVWQRMNDAVATIRSVEAQAQNSKHIIAVQGTRRWARDLEYYVEHPITAGEGTNIVYETHSYIHENEFAKVWINPADTLPVIIGEFGPVEWM